MDYPITRRHNLVSLIISEGAEYIHGAAASDEVHMVLRCC